MAIDFKPKTYRIFIESISENYLRYPNLLAFIETGSDNSTVIMTINHVSEAHKVDFELAMGGTRKDDGRQGILVYMRWLENPDMRSSITFTVWQQGAVSYGQVESLPEKMFDQGDLTKQFKLGALS